MNIGELLACLPGSRALDALELNEMRFSGRKTIITPARLKRTGVKKVGRR